MKQMTLINTIEVEFSKDLYKLEVLTGEFGTKFYYLYTNGNFDRSYKRLPKDLREFFGL
jgi:hypothetical protein